MIAHHEIADAGDRSCAIDVGRGLATAEQLLLPDQDRVGVLTQASVAPLAEHIAAEAREQGVTAAVRMLPDGDAAKNLGTVETVYEWLNSLGFTRSDQIVAVGGGALTDLSGFVAATYLRGVEVTYLPTTLLGAVDAAVGGKTGVNVGGKNLAGVFRHPARIVVDLDILDALPEQLLREGAAETVKAGFIRDAAIVSEYERAGIAASLEIVVPAAIAVKVDTVTADFTEQGQRAILNYGHTIGHAVEVAAGISHGEAVAIGMVAAGRVSEIVLGFGEAQRQRDIIASIGLPVTAPAVDIDQVAVLMGRDKKRDRDGIRMVLLEEFGSPVLRHVEPGVIDEALAAIGVL